MSDDAPGWQPDPTGRHDHRYWDGTRWTDNVSDAGVAGTDPFDGPTSTVPPTPPAPEAPADPSPTVAMGVPAADPTASWPAVPATPVSAGGDPASGGSSGGSKKGFLIGGGILAIIAIVVAVLALGGDDDDGNDRDRIHGELTSTLQDEADLSARDSRCVADFIIDELGEDTLADVDFDADEPPAEIYDDFFEAMGDGMIDCEVSGFDLDLPDDTDTTDDTADDTTDDTDDLDDLGDIDELPAGVREEMASQFEQQLGLSPEKADCLAGRMFDVIESGAIDEEDAMSDFMAYLSDCDISLSELSPN